MERRMKVRVDQQYGSRFVEEEEYRNKRVIRMEVIFYGRDYSSSPAGAPVPRVGLVVEKSYGCCKTFFVNRDELLSSLPSIMSQLVSPTYDIKVLGDNENERSEFFEKINSYAQSMPEPMLVRGTRVAAELLVRIDIERWKRLPIHSTTTSTE